MRKKKKNDSSVSVSWSVVYEEEKRWGPYHYWDVLSPSLHFKICLKFNPSPPLKEDYLYKKKDWSSDYSLSVWVVFLTFLRDWKVRTGYPWYGLFEKRSGHLLILVRRLVNWTLLQNKNQYTFKVGRHL